MNNFINNNINLKMSDVNDSKKSYIQDIAAIYEQHDKVRANCSGFYFPFFSDAKLRKCEREKNILWYMLREAKCEVILGIPGVDIELKFRRLTSIHVKD